MGRKEVWYVEQWFIHEGRMFPSDGPKFDTRREALDNLESLCFSGTAANMFIIRHEFKEVR